MPCFSWLKPACLVTDFSLFESGCEVFHCPIFCFPVHWFQHWNERFLIEMVVFGGEVCDAQNE